jgi:hypothetical protein
MREILKFFLDPQMYRDLVIILTPISVALLLFLYFRYRAQNDTMIAVVKFGIWCSTHPKIHSGEARDYFDSDLFLSEPENIGVVLQWFKEEMQQERATSGEINRLAFIEKQEGPVGAVTLKDLLSWHTKTASAVVRPRRKGPALRVKFVHDGLTRLAQDQEGRTESRKPFSRGGSAEKIVLVSDVATTGTTILEAVDLIQTGGGCVKAAFVLYDRQERSAGPDGRSMTAEERLRLRGIRLASMVKSHELKDAAIHNRRVRQAAEAKGFNPVESSRHESLT